MNMNTKFVELEIELMRHKVMKKDLAQILGMSSTYISNRFNGQQEWQLSDCYAILDYLKIPHERFTELFPCLKKDRREWDATL